MDRAAHVLTAKFWEGLADAIGRPTCSRIHALPDRPARIAHQDDLIALMAPVFRTRPRADWCAALEERRRAHAPVYDSSEALEDRQAKHLGIEVEAQHPTMGRFRPRCGFP